MFSPNLYSNVICIALEKWTLIRSHLLNLIRQVARIWTERVRSDHTNAIPPEVPPDSKALLIGLASANFFRAFSAL